MRRTSIDPPVRLSPLEWPRQGLWRHRTARSQVGRPLGLRTENRTQWTRKRRGRSAGLGSDVAAPDLDAEGQADRNRITTTTVGQDPYQ